MEVNFHAPVRESGRLLMCVCACACVCVCPVRESGRLQVEGVGGWLGVKVCECD